MLKKPILALTTRLMVAVLVTTFLAPGFGWQVVATHDELAHASPHNPFDDQHADEAHHHRADDLDHAAHHDEVAHGQIGHLLTHLPLATLTAVTLHAPAVEAEVVSPRRHNAHPPADGKRPYKPPRLSFFA